MFNNEAVAAFGKIFFIPIHESIPQLPEMSLLFMKKRNRGIIYHGERPVLILKLTLLGIQMTKHGKI